MTTSTIATVPVRCACGEQLAEGADGERILLDGEWRPFRRSTDYLVCGSCLVSVPVEEVHARRET